MAEVDALTAATHRYIQTNPKLIDGIFQNDPLAAMLRDDLEEDFPGGLGIYETIIYSGSKGGGFTKGDTFNTTEKQKIQQIQFQPKFLYTNITMSLIDTDVFNKGDAAVIRLIETETDLAYRTIGAFMALGIYFQGQSGDYVKNFNGLAEIVNDGSTASWDGSTYANYGTIPRANVNGALTGKVTALGGAAITYQTLESTYSSCSIGGADGEPNIGITTYLAYSYIKNRFQTQQRFNDTQEPKIGLTGLKFNNATILRSRYCPGTEIDGTVDPNAVEWLTQTTGGNVVSYPAQTAETFFWLNARKPYMRLYVATSPKFGFGFRGFYPAPNNLELSGQVMFAGNLVSAAPRLHCQITGING